MTGNLGAAEQALKAGQAGQAGRFTIEPPSRGQVG
jgi:hypothetical protein